MNETRADQLEPIMHQCKAVADAAREAHPEVSFARLATMLQAASDWARTEAWKEARDGKAEQRDADGEELIQVLRDRSSSFAKLVSVMRGGEEFQGFYVDPSTSNDITADLDIDMREASPREVRRAADKAAARLLELHSKSIGVATLALITAIAADTALAGVAVNMPEALYDVEETIRDHRAVLHHAVLQDLGALGAEVFPTGWEQDAAIGAALLALEDQEAPAPAAE
jgi:hypothetical protein